MKAVSPLRFFSSYLLYFCHHSALHAHSISLTLIQSHLLSLLIVRLHYFVGSPDSGPYCSGKFNPLNSLSVEYHPHIWQIETCCSEFNFLCWNPKTTALSRVSTPKPTIGQDYSKQRRWHITTAFSSLTRKAQFLLYVLILKSFASYPPILYVHITCNSQKKRLLP